MRVSAVSVSQQIAILDSGEVAPFTNMFDFDGEETTDPQAAVSAIAQLPSGQWAVILFDEFEGVPLQ